MHTSNPISRIFFFVFAFVIMLGIFFLIVRRGSVLFGFSLKFKIILLLALGMVGLLITSFMLTSLSVSLFEIIGLILLWIIYILRVLGPVLIFADIVSLWYKIPPILLLIVSVVWIALGIYYGTTIKTTSLQLSNSRILQDQKIVFISDLHVEAIHHTKYIQKIVNRIKDIHPDIVLIGGDMMNIAKTGYADAFLPFNQLMMPVYATLGNHDNMGDPAAIDQIFSTTKIIPLRNQSILVSGLQIVGIDDKSYRGKETLSEILAKSTINNDANYTLLISHQPQKLSYLTGYPIDLELAGHTHNGQFWPMSWIIKLFNDYAYGRYDEQGKTAFVSQGVGTRGAPMRIGTQSEIVVISLQHIDSHY